MDTTHGLAAILRDARKGALLRMRSEIYSQSRKRGRLGDRVSSYLLIPRIEIVARRRRRGHAFGTRAVRPAAPAREALAIALEAARGAIDLRLRSGDERRQAIDADIIRDHRLRLRLWLRLKLRLRAMLAVA